MGTYGYASNQLLVDFQNTKKKGLKCNPKKKLFKKFLKAFENEICHRPLK
jgi:hypothetical protein